MRAFVMADIHANLAALEAVLSHFDPQTMEEVWCLGDLVGYGPDPNECIERIRELPIQVVAGNHDWAAIGKLDISDFNPAARQACLWTAHELTPQNVEYLENLPTRLVQDEFTLVHGSPREPIWEYVLHPWVALASFAHFDTSFCLVGHTHVPLIFQESQGPNRLPQSFLPELNTSLPLGDSRLIINPGGVGQPRDGDPRASFLILDTEKAVFEYNRVPYPIEVTQEKMRKVGLPESLIMRLEYGR